MNELLRQSEELHLSKDIETIKSHLDEKECLVCYDTFNVKDGYECSQHHFVCHPNGKNLCYFYYY